MEQIVLYPFSWKKPKILRWIGTWTFLMSLIATNPYWLNEEPPGWQRYQLKDTMYQSAETPHLFRVVFHMNLASPGLGYRKTIVHKHRDPVRSFEVYQPLPIIPQLHVNPQEPASHFSGRSCRIDIEATVGRPEHRTYPGTWDSSVPDTAGGWTRVNQPCTIGTQGG